MWKKEKSLSAFSKNEFKVYLHTNVAKNYGTSNVCLNRSSNNAQGEGTLDKLTYQQPASKWTEALPLGNGRLGAMHFGGVESDRFQLNEDTLWSGPPQQIKRESNQQTLQEVRELIEKQDYTKAINETKNMFGPYTEAYVPLGDLTITYLHGNIAHNYRRELDISKALSHVTYHIGQTEYQREAFISHPHDVLAIKLTSSDKEKLSFTVSLSSLLKNKSVCSEQMIAVQGVCPEINVPSYYHAAGEPIVYGEIGKTKAIHFEGRLGIKTDGAIDVSDGKALIEHATEAVLYFSVATSFKGFDQRPGCDLKALTDHNEALLQRAMEISYDQLKAAHIADYTRLYDRVSFTLEKPAEDLNTPHVNTDQSVKMHGANDLNLIELLFQYGRYLLICSSREGTQPANLQGIWNDQTRAPWSSNYTLNINTEMNYWPAEVTNLSECHEPLLKAISELAVTGKEMVHERYGLRGWTANHNTDLWRHSDPVGGDRHGDPVWAFWPMSGPWLARHLWEHFQYTQDTEFLADVAIDLMKGAAEFCLDWLVEDESGYLMTSPSTSPEHTFYTDDGQLGSVTKGATMDLQIIWDLFTNCLNAADILGLEDTEWIVHVKEARDRLFPLQIGKQGRLQEWAKDYNDGEKHHRHVSHLYGVYPGNQITEGPLLDAVRQTLNIRGDAGTGWSLGWKLNLWARLKDGERAHDLLHLLFNVVDTEQELMARGGLYPNLLGAHPPFQIDGNFGYTASVVEMIVQSHQGFIELLPALPSSWHTGTLTGVCARGGYTLNLTWENMKMVSLDITAKTNSTCRLKTDQRLTMEVSGEADRHLNPVNGLISIEMEQGKTYQLSF